MIRFFPTSKFASCRTSILPQYSASARILHLFRFSSTKNENNHSSNYSICEKMGQCHFTQSKMFINDNELTASATSATQERNNNNHENNTGTDEMKAPPHVACSMTASSVLHDIATVLLGNAVTVLDPNSNLTSFVIQLPRDQLPSNFAATIVAAGHQILLHQNEEARIQRRKFEEVECVFAVARRLMRLHGTLGAKFVDASRDEFKSFAKWNRSQEVAALFDAFVECLTKRSFNNNTQSVLELLKPLLENPPSIADLAFKKYDDGGWRGEFAASLDKIGCAVVFGCQSRSSFYERLIAVPDQQKCGFVDASALAGGGRISELKSHLVNNITGSSGAGKTQNAILASASWDPMNPGVTVQVDMNDVGGKYWYATERNLRALGDQGKTNTRNVACTTRLLNAVASALGSLSSVRFATNDVSNVDDLGKFLTDNFSKCFSSIGIGKKFFGKVVIVVDEIGFFHAFHRGLCCSWKAIRKFLAQELHLDSEDQLFLVTAGTGSENMIEQVALESLEETYAIYTVNTPSFFANCLKGLSENGETASIRLWASTILNCLYCRQLSTNEMVLKQEGIDRRTSYFARMATYNCRIAALAIQTIINAAAATSSVTQSESSIRLEFSSKSAEWAITIAKKFRQLNKLGSYIAQGAHDAIAKAIRVVMLRQKSFASDDEIEHMCVNLGLLEEAARVVSKFDPKKHELIKHVNEKYLVIAKGTSRYRIPETYVAMFLSYTSINGSAAAQTKDNNGNIIISSRGALELATADHHALVASLAFANAEMPAAGTFTPLPEPSKSLAEMKLTLDYFCCHCAVERFFCDEHKHEGDFSWLSPTFPEQSVWDTWRARINEGGCVVIVNGKAAPFADVIVLAPGRVFLTRCSNNNNIDDANEEFSKMLESSEKMPNGSTNEELRKKIAACCKRDDTVHFAATIVVLSATVVRSRKNNKFPKRKVNDVMWWFLENKIVTAFEHGMPQQASFLYPVLSTRIQGESATVENDNDNGGDMKVAEDAAKQGQMKKNNNKK